MKLKTQLKVVYEITSSQVRGQARAGLMNQVDTFTFEEQSQTNSVEITSANWPTNKNFTCDPGQLQLNSSLTWFICAESYDSFMDKLKSIEWMSTIAEMTDQLALKGGAILDLLSDRKPKDYDFMNLGMTNEEFIQFLIKFCKKTKPQSITFLSSRINLFRVKMKNNDLIEFVVNSDLTRDRLFAQTYLPDQIAYLPRENKLLANEYTLWSLNHGFCSLKFDKFPKALRLSEKINKLGFNFFYDEQVVNNTEFLKGRLERYVWSISQGANQSVRGKRWPQRRPIRASMNDEDVDKQSWQKIQIVQGVLYASGNSEDAEATIEAKVATGKRLFASHAEILTHIKTKVTEGKEGENVLIDFNGAVILSETKNASLSLFNGIDWKF